MLHETHSAFEVITKNAIAWTRLTIARSLRASLPRIAREERRLDAVGVGRVAAQVHRRNYGVVEEIVGQNVAQLAAETQRVAALRPCEVVDPLPHRRGDAAGVGG